MIAFTSCHKAKMDCSRPPVPIRAGEKRAVENREGRHFPKAGCIVTAANRHRFGPSRSRPGAFQNRPEDAAEKTQPPECIFRDGYSCRLAWLVPHSGLIEACAATRQKPLRGSGMLTKRNLPTPKSRAAIGLALEADPWSPSGIEY